MKKRKIKKQILDMYNYVNSGEIIPYPISLPRTGKEYEVLVYKIIIDEKGMWLFFNHPENCDNLQLLIPLENIIEN